MYEQVIDLPTCFFAIVRVPRPRRLGAGAANVPSLVMLHCIIHRTLSTNGVTQGSFRTLAGLHVGLLLPPVLDGPPPRLQEAAWRRDAVGGLRVHPEHLGAGHLLRQREAVLLPFRNHQQRVHTHPPLRLHHALHQVPPRPAPLRPAPRATITVPAAPLSG